LAGVAVTDIYESETTKSVTVRLTFSSDEKTLSMDEIQPIVDAIVADLDEIGIKLRA